MPPLSLDYFIQCFYPSQHVILKATISNSVLFGWWKKLCSKNRKSKLFYWWGQYFFENGWIIGIILNITNDSICNDNLTEMWVLFIGIFVKEAIYRIQLIFRFKAKRRKHVSPLAVENLFLWYHMCFKEDSESLWPPVCNIRGPEWAVLRAFQLCRSYSLQLPQKLKLNDILHLPKDPLWEGDHVSEGKIGDTISCRQWCCMMLSFLLVWQVTLILLLIKIYHMCL